MTRRTRFPNKFGRDGPTERPPPPARRPLTADRVTHLGEHADKVTHQTTCVVAERIEVSAVTNLNVKKMVFMHIKTISINIHNTFE